MYEFNANQIFRGGCPLVQFLKSSAGTLCLPTQSLPPDRTAGAGSRFFPIPTLHQILSEDTGSEHPIFGEVPKIVDANLWNKPFREELEGFENFRPSDEIATEESCDSEPDSAILNEQEEPIAKEQVETESSDSTPAFALFAVVGALALIVIAFVVMRKKKR